MLQALREAKILVYTNLSPDVYRAILLKADEYGLPVAGHIPRDLNVTAAFESGQTAIEHLGDYADSVESDGSPFLDGWHWSKRFLGMPMDLAEARSIADQQRQTGVWTTPTMVQADKELAPADSVRSWLEAQEMVYVEAEGRDYWTDLSEESREQMDDEDWELVSRGRQNRIGLTRMLHSAGVRLLVGTDTPNPFVTPVSLCTKNCTTLLQLDSHQARPWPQPRVMRRSFLATLKSRVR